MAKMYPHYEKDELVSQIKNDGERIFYEACMKLPDSYQVVYSFEYFNRGQGEREADFIIVHPAYGYLVVEVKEGEIAYKNRKWYEWKQGLIVLDKDPKEQAKSAMYKIRDLYSKKTGKKFPLKYAYALCFPESDEVQGILPVEDEMIFTKDTLENLDSAIKSAFTVWNNSIVCTNAPVVIQQLMSNVLNQSGKTKSQSIGRWIGDFHEKAEVIFTEEQEHILRATSLENRLVFLGAAGSGKTFLAMEKAKRLAKEGKKVLLTCYNSLLAEFMNEKLKETKLAHNIEIRNYHHFSLGFLRKSSVAFEIPSNTQEKNHFFKYEVPELVLDCSDFIEDKFDSIIIDEGQDFSEEWILSLCALLNNDGDLFMFADENQTLFGDFDKRIYNLIKCSRYRLTLNLRNTEKIHEWISQFTIHKEYFGSAKLKNGKPIEFKRWKTQNEERREINKVLNYLLSQGVKPQQIVILSPFRKENSCLSDVSYIANLLIEEGNQIKDRSIRFATIMSYKGLEADVVLLIGIQNHEYLCSKTNLYVGGSRAKYYLNIFHHVDFKPWLVKK